MLEGTLDIFYRTPEPRHALTETMGPLATAVHAGKALYEDISVYWATSPLRAGRRWLSWHSLGPCVTRA